MLSNGQPYKNQKNKFFKRNRIKKTPSHIGVGQTLENYDLNEVHGKSKSTKMRKFTGLRKIFQSRKSKLKHMPSIATQVNQEMYTEEMQQISINNELPVNSMALNTIPVNTMPIV